MVSTIMKFLDSGPNKAVDSTLKTRILASEPDNAEGIHNFAPLGKKTVLDLLLWVDIGWCETKLVVDTVDIRLVPF